MSPMVTMTWIIFCEIAYNFEKAASCLAKTLTVFGGVYTNSTSFPFISGLLDEDVHRGC